MTGINSTRRIAPQMLVKVAGIFVIAGLVGWLANLGGIATEPRQMLAVSTFLVVICTTLFFWQYRLAAAFLGIAVLIGTRVLSLRGMIMSTELDIILFLVGMMTIVGVLKDLGLFTWIIQQIIGVERMNGWLFTLILSCLSGLMASLVDEVTSIVVVLALVFQVCDTLKIKSTPFVLIAVMATNIGSSATMLGNPVGIFIGTKAGFTFGYFLKHAMPVAVVALVPTLFLLFFWYRREIGEMSQRMRQRREDHRGLGPLFRIPYRRGLFILLGTVTLIAFHRRIEEALGLVGPEDHNAFLIVTPLIVAGALMLYRPHRARHYIEHDVEWWTLLFFMMLFAIAGGLSQQGVTDALAEKLRGLADGGVNAMIPFVLFLASVGSAFVDNIVFVAAFTPVIQVLEAGSPEFGVLWWALLFGACFGGNITAIGSTANLVALGMVEKRYHAHILFLEWLKIGAVVGLVTFLIAWGMMRTNLFDPAALSPGALQRAAQAAGRTPGPAPAPSSTPHLSLQAEEF